MAFICRYAHQDVYRILGRDPMRRPLSARELRLLSYATLWHVKRENAVSTNEPDSLNDPEHPADD